MPCLNVIAAITLTSIICNCAQVKQSVIYLNVKCRTTFVNESVVTFLEDVAPWAVAALAVKMMGCTTPPSASASASCPPFGLRCLSGVPWQCLFSPRCCWSSLRQPTRLCGLKFASKCLNFAMSVTMCFVAPEATMRPFPSLHSPGRLPPWMRTCDPLHPPLALPRLTVSVYSLHLYSWSSYRNYTIVSGFGTLQGFVTFLATAITNKFHVKVFSSSYFHHAVISWASSSTLLCALIAPQLCLKFGEL